MFFYIRLTFIIIIIFLFSNFLILSDSTSDKIKLYFLFSYKQQFTSVILYNNYYNFYLNNEINFNINIPYKIYTFSTYLTDNFLIDFDSIIYKSNNFNITEIFFNSLSLLLENYLHFKNKIKMFYNFEFNLNIPFYDNIFLNFIPVIKFEGNYYTGFIWLLEQSIQFSYITVTDKFNINSISYFKIGYEFFRFYGPDFLKFSIISDNEFNILFYSYDSIKNFENKVSIGLNLKIYNFNIFSFFTDIINYQYENNYLTYNNIGNISGISYNYKFFSFYLQNRFLYDLNSNNNWKESIDFFIKFIIIK